jgi:putative inorganic carbon (HCO3(-)) transporter
MYKNISFSNSPRILILIFLTLGAATVMGILAGYHILLVLLVILLGLVVLVFVAQPEFITLAVLFIVYTNAAVVAVKFHGLPFTIGASISMLLIIPLIYNLVFRGHKLNFSTNFILLFGFLLVQLLGTLFSVDVKVARDNLISFISEGLILYFLIINTVRTPKTMRWAIWTLLIAGAFLGGLSYYQQITGTFDNTYWGFAQAAGAAFGTGVENLQGVIEQSRLGGPLGEKNYYAQIMLVLIPLGLFLLQGERWKLLRLLAGIFTMVIFIGIVLTFSRGVAVAFVLMLLVMLIMRYIKLQQIVIVLGGVFLLFQLFPQYSTRLSSLQALLTITQADSAGVSGTDISTQGRIGEMSAAWLVFLDHPVIGVGPGMYKFYYTEYIDRVGLQTHIGPREAHDIFLGIAADHGIFGLLLFLSILAVSLINLEKVRRQTRKTHPDISNMAIGFFLAIIAYLATGIFLSLAYERYFWLILGLADALVMIAARQEALDLVDLSEGVR